MKNIQKIGFLSVLLFVISCSTKKDAFLNRNYNALTTQYNILYNGDDFPAWRVGRRERLRLLLGLPRRVSSRLLLLGVPRRAARST